MQQGSVGRIRVHRRLVGFTLLEMMISLAILAVLSGIVGKLLNEQVGIVGHVGNQYYCSSDAQSSMWKMRNVLLSAVQSPNGVTAARAPVFTVYSPTSGSAPNLPSGESSLAFSYIIWRRPVGYSSAVTAWPTYPPFNLIPGLPAPSACSDCLSSNQVYDAPFAEALYVDTTSFSGLNVLTYAQFTGSTFPPSGANVLHKEYIAGNPNSQQTVTDFRIFNGESTLPFAWDGNSADDGVKYAKHADTSTYLYGIYLRVEHKSLNPFDYSKTSHSQPYTTSNPNNSTSTTYDLHMSVLIQPETMTTTTGKAFVGP